MRPGWGTHPHTWRWSPPTHLGSGSPSLSFGTVQTGVTLVDGERREAETRLWGGAQWDVSDGGQCGVGGTHSVAFYSGETRSPREATSALWGRIGLR